MATIIGTIGDDNLTGTSGDDLMYGYDPSDQADTDGGNDTLDGGDGNDTLFGGNGNDTLIGGAGNDWLDDGRDGISMVDGVGDDVYVITGNFAEVTEGLDEGIDLILAPGLSEAEYTLPANVENLTIIGDGTNIRVDGNRSASMRAASSTS